MAGRVVIVFMGESFPVMAGLVPAIHVFVLPGCKDVDARHKATAVRLSFCGRSAWH
jgi:hypothetical protein